MNNIYISNTEVALRKPFLYFIAIIKPLPLLYVGQTCQRQGVIGRLTQHLDDDGTLRKRAIDAGIADFETVSVFILDLTSYKEFNELHNRKRDALEYLMHCDMKAKGCKANQPFEVISNVRYNSLTLDFKLQKLSRELVDIVSNHLPFFN